MKTARIISDFESGRISFKEMQKRIKRATVKRNRGKAKNRRAWK